MNLIVKLDDTKEVIIYRKSKDGQYNSHMKKDWGHTMIYERLCRKLKIEQHEPHKKTWMKSGPSEWEAVHVLLLGPLVW